MESFKQYIFESDQKKELFHSFFVSKAGKIIEPTSNPLYANKEVIDHTYIPATQAHDFNMRDAEMHDLLELSDEEVLNYYKHGKGPLNASADRRLSTRGFIKGKRHDTKRNINLQATTSNARDAYHIDDMSEIITSLRSRFSEHPDWVISIDGLKTHEPEELESMKHRLSPAHIEQLTQPGKQFTLVNTDEIDRFITGRGSLSRDPGSGVHSVPSPTEMKRKAGRTDEPESIQRGRFFQSDSFDYSLGANMKTFKQHLHEVKFGPEFGPELANRDVGREFSPGGKFSYTSERAPHETTDPFNPHEHSELLMNFLHDNRMDDRLIAKGERLDRVSPRAQHYMGVIQDAKHHLTRLSNMTDGRGEKIIDPMDLKNVPEYDEKDGSDISHDLHALRVAAQGRYSRLASPIELKNLVRIVNDPDVSPERKQAAYQGLENNQKENKMKTRIAKLLMSSKRARLIFASEVKQHYDQKERENISKDRIE